MNPSWTVLCDFSSFFVCERWLAVDEDDGMIERMIPRSGQEEITSFSQLFSSTTKKNITDGHLW